MVLAHYGRQVPLEELRVQCGVSRDGSKASNVLKAARKYGLTGKGYKKETEALLSMQMPLIIHWNFNHFLVLEGARKRRVYLNDPASGRRTVSYDELDQSFTGIALAFERGEGFVRTARTHSALTTIGTQLKKNAATLAFLLCAALLVTLTGLLLPLFTRVFVDSILQAGQRSWFSVFALAFVLLLVAKAVLTLLEKAFLLRLKIKLAAELAGTFFWKLLHLPLSFFSQRYAGDIAGRTEAAMSIAESLSGKLVGAGMDACMVLFYAVLLFYFDATLTLVCMALTAVSFVGAALLKTRLRIGNQRMQQDRAKYEGVSINGLQIIESLKAGGREAEFFAKWAGYQAKYENSRQSVSHYTNALSILSSTMAQLTSACVLILGAWRVMRGGMTFGTLVAFQQLVASFLAPMNRLVGISASYQQLVIDIGRINDAMHYIEALPTPAADAAVASAPLSDGERAANAAFAAHAQPQGALQLDAEEAPIATSAPTKLQGHVQLEHITFGYNLLEPPLLNAVSLTIRAGMRIALVGGSGSGKSTIAKLLSGLYTPWEGRICFDGVPASIIDRTALLASVSMVDQDITLFEGTVRDNLTLWDTTIPDADIVRACEDACIHDDIMRRPDGYDAKVEEGGRNFSGGQRQRLEIARALVTNPRVLIMDEATSALDAASEKRIGDNIRRRGCTSIIVAHRISTIRDCDRIVVLEKGRIVQMGTHAELSRDVEGAYYSLVTAV